MRTEELYKEFETAEARVLWLIARKGYGTMSALAQDVGIGLSYFTSRSRTPRIALKYASYLGRKFGVAPALLAYEDYVQTCPVVPQSYLDLVKGKFFSKQDAEYILQGDHVKDPVKWLRQQDNAIKAKRNGKR